jgi:hypothetical protein
VRRLLEFMAAAEALVGLVLLSRVLDRLRSMPEEELDELLSGVLDGAELSPEEATLLADNLKVALGSVRP